MRIVTWMLMGIGAGALAGFVSALLRRRHHSIGEPVADYAGGYAAPVASEDRTASHPANTVVTDSSNSSEISAPSVENGTGHANGAGRPHRVDHVATADRTERAEHVGRGGHR